MGTVEVLAPEILKKQAADHRIDIFAFGVTAYEVLTGHWPFESPEHHQTSGKILNVRPVPIERRNEDLPEEVAQLVMRCLDKNPEKRLSSMNTAEGVLLRYMGKGL
jgi:serine/threonine protein kinase